METSLAHVAVPLVGCVASVGSAVAIWLHDPDDEGNRVATTLVASCGWWALCQVLWTIAPSPERAQVWHKLAGFGWAWVGPLALHLIAHVLRAQRRVARALPALYAVGGVFAALQVFTPWMHDQVTMTRFGWAFEPGWGFRFYLLFTYGCAVPAVVLALRAVLSAPSPAERRQVLLMAAAIGSPLVLASATAAVMPLLGIPSPRLAATSFSVLGVAVAWSYHRYGFSVLVPGSFSREILATLAEGVGLVGLDGQLLSGNRALAELLGEPPDALPGLPLASRIELPLLEPERTFRGVECELVQGSGERIPVAVSTSLLRDNDGLARGVVLVLHDLRQVVVLRNQLVTSGRLAAVGELAAGIAHEINNPTAFVRANLAQLQEYWEELRKELGAGDERRRSILAEGDELIAESIEGVERTTAIVRDVRNFAHRGSREREPVAVNDLVDQALRLASPQLRYRASVVRRFSEVPLALGSPQELKQVFLNLIVNAAQAIEDDGTVEVTTRRAGDFVEVVLRDDGSGIAPEHRERIFDPFFTTKPAGEGTGLGLAISYQILRSQRAEIAVESEPGEGTTFTVRLPMAPDDD